MGVHSAGFPSGMASTRVCHKPHLQTFTVHRRTSWKSEPKFTNLDYQLTQTRSSSPCWESRADPEDLGATQLQSNLPRGAPAGYAYATQATPQLIIGELLGHIFGRTLALRGWKDPQLRSKTNRWKVNQSLGKMDMEKTRRHGQKQCKNDTQIFKISCFCFSTSNFGYRLELRRPGQCMREHFA